MNSHEIYDYIIKIQSISKIGLTYSKDPYAITNYNEINRLSLEMLEKFENVKFDRPNYFEKNIYPTPNVSVRSVIFNDDETKVLLVRETNGGGYSLPGGWADLYDSPSDAAKKECLQEAGVEVEIVKLCALLSHTPFSKACFSSIPDYVIVFKGKIIKIHQEHDYETDDVNFFPIDDLPQLSGKCLKSEILKMIDAAKKEEVIFD